MASSTAKSYFLTGCGSGMGRHLTSALVRRGENVYATDVNLAALEKAKAELGWPEDQVKIAPLNVCDAAAWEIAFADAVAAFGRIHVTMNIAGLLLASWAHETALKEIDSQIDVNVKGVIFGTRVSAQHMLAQGGGHIVNIASAAGLVPVPGLSTYCASKAACRSYSISAAFELRPKGVYVTAVCPITIQTPLLDNQLHNDAAEMFFSGRKILTLEDIEREIFEHVLVNKPYEVAIPRMKGIMAKFANWFPGIGPLMAAPYQASGRKRQARRRAGDAQA